MTSWRQTVIISKAKPRPLRVGFYASINFVLEVKCFGVWLVWFSVSDWWEWPTERHTYSLGSVDSGLISRAIGKAKNIPAKNTDTSSHPGPVSCYFMTFLLPQLLHLWECCHLLPPMWVRASEVMPRAWHSWHGISLSLCVFQSLVMPPMLLVHLPCILSLVLFTFIITKKWASQSGPTSGRHIGPGSYMPAPTSWCFGRPLFCLVHRISGLIYL